MKAHLILWHAYKTKRKENVEITNVKNGYSGDTRPDKVHVPSWILVYYIFIMYQSDSANLITRIQTPGYIL